MKNVSFYTLLFVCLASLSSCEAIGAIFKAGVWSGILLVALVIGLVIFIASRFTKKD